MNLSDLRTRFRKQLGNPDPTQVTDAELNEALNEAYQHLLDRYPHSSSKSWFRFETVSGTSGYAIPGHVGAINFVWDTATWARIPKLPDESVQENDARGTGRPRGWVRVGSFIVLYPEPDGAYEIGVQGKVVSAPLAADDDEPLLDPTWHDGILRRARYEWWDHYHPDISKARNALVSWNEWITTKPSSLTEELQPQGVAAPALAMMLGGFPNFPRRFNNNYWAWPRIPE